MTRTRRIEDSVAKFLELQETPSPVSLAEHLETVDRDIRLEVEEVCLTALSMQSAFGTGHSIDGDDLVGKRLGDHEIMAFIGEGGMGRVFRARRAGATREVALKVIRPDRLDRQSFDRRFDRESALLARLDHPGIVKAIERGEDGGRVFYTMDFVEGPSLRDVLLGIMDGHLLGDPAEAALLLPDDPRNYVRAARLVSELASAVAHAHGRGVYHRDLKPENILIGPGGRPRIIDFGLGGDVDSLSSFEADGFPGTRPYAPPTGKHPGTSAERDLWALGVILYEVLTTERPFRTELDHTLTEALQAGYYPPPERRRPDLPPDLGRIVRKALAHDPDDRYRTAAELDQDLNRFLAGEPALAGRRSHGKRLLRHLRRHRAIYAGLAVVVASATTAFVVAQRAESRRIHGELLQATRRSSGGTSLESRLADLTRQSAAVETLLAGRDLPEDTRAAVQEEWRRIGADADAILETSTEGLRAARGSSAGAPLSEYRLPSEPELFHFLEIAARAKAIRGDTAPSDPFDEVFPTLTIEADFPRANEAIVTIRPLDILSGTLREVVYRARFPLKEARVPPGLVVIEITIPGFGHAQYVRDIDRTDRLVLPARVLSEGEAQSRVPMVSIPAGKHRVGQPGGGDRNVFLEREVETRGFLIDQYETTCAEYREFLAANPSEPLPLDWGEDLSKYDPAWDRLPVRGVNWRSAHRYAEWRGKRLPTWIEWQIAVRGPNAFVFPWGNEPGKIEELATVRRAKGSPVPPIGSSPGDTSPFGVVDGYGSVREWTCSPYVTFCEGRLYPTGGWRIVVSRSHEYSPPEQRSLMSGVTAILPGAPEEGTIGIRCVRSSPLENHQ